MSSRAMSGKHCPKWKWDGEGATERGRPSFAASRIYMAMLSWRKYWKKSTCKHLNPQISPRDNMNWWHVHHLHEIWYVHHEQIVCSSSLSLFTFFSCFVQCSYEWFNVRLTFLDWHDKSDTDIERKEKESANESRQSNEKESPETKKWFRIRWWSAEEKTEEIDQKTDQSLSENPEADIKSSRHRLQWKPVLAGRGDTCSSPYSLRIVHNDWFTQQWQNRLW